MAGILGIIGGGASGLCAAVTAARLTPGRKITVYERGERVGRKLLATGNGRCNLTNRFFALKNYHGRSPGFTQGAFSRFGLEETLAFFESVGIPVREEENGKLFPRSLQAASVLDALRLEALRLGVEIRVQTPVSAIRPGRRGFILIGEKERFFADQVILAAGGKASPSLGGCEEGYRILKELGHRISPLFPSIVPVKARPEFTKPLSGVKVEGVLTLFAGEKALKSESGEVLFTDYGLSGPPVMQLSCLLRGREDCRLTLDLCPEYEKKALLSLLRQRRDSRPDIPLEQYFTGFLHKKLGMALLKAAGAAPLSRPSGSLTEGELSALTGLLKALPFPVLGTTGFQNAQVTAGGADTSLFDPETLESKLIPGLFACGEVLDIDGDCGGFNLQWAWSSGMLAAHSAR